MDSFLPVPLEAYLVQRANEQEGPTFLFNFSVGASCKWRHIEVRELTPVCAPPQLVARGLGSVHEIKDPSSQGSDILRAGVLVGLFISWPALKQLCFMYDVEVEKPGSGTKGVLIKIDWAKALIKNLHPEADEAEKARMLAAIMIRVAKHTLTEDNQKILDVLEQLDPENACSEVVAKVRALAKETWKAQVRKEIQDEIHQESEAKRRKTIADDDAAQLASLPHGGGPGNRQPPPAERAPEVGPRKPYTKHDLLRALYPGEPPGPPYPRRTATAHHVKWEVPGPSLTGPQTPTQNNKQGPNG